MKGPAARIRLVFALALLVPVPATAQAVAAADNPTSISAPVSVARGGWFPVFPVDGASSIVEIAVVDPEGRETVGTPGFYLSPDSETTVPVAIQGVPSTYAPGEYTFRAVIRVADGSELEVAIPIEVADRPFVSAVIPLSSDMTSLRTDQSRRRREESVELTELLFSAQSKSVFYWNVFDNPVPDGIESSAFGDRRTYTYFDGTRAYSVHNGLDLAAPTGTPVFAPAAGRVVMAKERIISGNTVVVEHLPGVYGLFYHLDSTSVEVGDLLRRGDGIGTVGATGLVTGPHLHWEVRIGPVAVDPALLLTSPLVDISEIITTLNHSRPVSPES